MKIGSRRSASSGTRSGYTLIEIVSVMSIFSVLMSIAVAWILQTMRFDSIVQERMTNHGVMMQLNQRLRDDIRHGQSMSMRDDEQLTISQLTILLGDNRSATYRLSPHRLDYRRQNEQGIEQHESYRFLDDSSVHWDTSAMPNSIGLIVRRNAETGNASPVDLNIRATLDSDRSLSRVEMDDR